MVYSATSASAALGNGDPMSYLKRQAVYAFIGLVFMIVASRFDYHRLRYVAPPFLLVALVLCPPCSCSALRSTARAAGSSSARASFQPSELAKLALCLFASVVSRPPARAAHARRAPEAARPADADLLRADRGRARPRDDDHALRDDARDPPRRRRSDEAPRRPRSVPRSRSGRSRSGSSPTAAPASSAS